MLKITAVKLQKKNPHRFNIFLDGSFSFGADEDLVVDARLIVGKELSDKQLEELLFKAQVGKLMEKVYRLLNIRLRSEKEIRDYFKIKNLKFKIKNEEQYNQLAIEHLIELLKQKKLIDDLRFAKEWVQSRRKNKKKGINAIKAELFVKGIDREIIEEVLGDIAGISEQQLAQQALEKKERLWKNLSALEFRKKAYSYLARKGFEFNIIHEIVENYLKKG